MNADAIFPLLAVIVACFAFVATFYFNRSEQSDRRREYKQRALNDRIDGRLHAALKDSGLNTLSDRMARLEVTVDIYTRAVAFDAAKALHSPHIEMSRRDYLLERLLASEISPAEQGELYRMLYGSAFGPFTEGLPAGERVAASLVLRLLESMDDDNRNAAERLHTLDQPTMSASLTVSPEGNVLTWQGDVAGVLGHDPAQLIGEPVAVVLPAWAQLADESVDDMPHHRAATDAAGRERPVWVTLSPSPDWVTVRIETRDPDATLAESPLH